MKKLLAILLAVAMIMGIAMTASAKETTLADLDCSGWWTAHSEGVEVTEEGVTVTFTSTTYADAAGNWDGPLWMLYTSDDGTITYPDIYTAPNYVEYWVHRVDNYGWGFGVNRWSAAEDLANVGVTINAVDSRTDAWENFLTELKAGINCTLTVKLEGANAVANFVAAGIDTTISLPVDTTKPVYLALTGEMATLTNIKVVTPDPVVEEPAEPAEDVVTELYGSSEAASGWVQKDINTTLWGGELDASCMVEGGYLSINFTTEDISQVWQVRLALNAPWTELDWHVDPSTVANPVGVLNDLGNGNYSVTFSYDDIVAIYGTSDFAANLGSMSFITNSGAPVAITSVTYTVPAPDSSNPKAGDSIAVVFALMAVSAAGIAVVAKKKEF